MKNKLLFAASLVALTMFLGVIAATHAALTPPHGGWKWLGPAYNGYDSFHQTDVVAYEYNSNATLSVTVYNDYATKLNISALKVGMSWGINYTSSMTSLATPYNIPFGESRVIPIDFKVPDQSVVSNQVEYSYTIYLEYVNSTSGPQKIVGSDTAFGGNNFVVYSADQVDAQKTASIIQSEMAITPAMYKFNSTRGKLLWIQAENESLVANMAYSQRNFADAKSHYQNALNMINQAFTAEQNKGGAIDDAQVDLIKAEAESQRASANYLNGLSNMWILIGVAAILFAIGYILRGIGSMRKPMGPSA
jgi:hypothetical protein